MKISKKRIAKIFTLMLVAVFALTNLVGVVYAGQESGAIRTGIKVTNTTNVAKSVMDQYLLTNDEAQIGSYADDELVWAVVSLNKKSVLDSALQYNPSDYRQYLTTYQAQEEAAQLTAYQNQFLAKYKNVIKDISHRYTTLLNGFAVQLRYGDVGLLEADKQVQSVILSETYLAPKITDSSKDDVTQNLVDVYYTGIYDSSDVAYDGTGTVIAVLDTGLDQTHSAFQTQPTGKLALEKDRVANLLTSFEATKRSESVGDKLTADDLYYSDKIPFAYDYADNDPDVYPKENHGTHVAGIIGGKDDNITGVATNAQLAIFKVFSNYKQGAETEDILAALNDCVVLGVDAINMSLGSSCGFSREIDEFNTDVLYDKIKQTGICLICAASNDYSSTMQSPNGDTGLTTNPDTGTVGSPSSYEASMSVASISGVKTKYVTVNGEKFVYYTEAGHKISEDEHDFSKELLGDKQTGTFEYVVVPGLGTESNYYDLDVAGKIAVIKRGTTSFEEKISIAESKGAIAAIVYNNVTGTISMSVGKAKIPSIFVTMEFGKYFEEHKTGTLVADVNNLAGPFMSDFSSWGPLGDLELKPDITAHGGEIYSAVRGGYDVLSGTSMAAPNMAGATILVRQYVKERFPTMAPYDVTELTYRLLMSTATIAYNEDGNPYSPRKQGAGLADINKSVTTPAYAYVEGSNKTKLSLGDDVDRTGVYTMEYNVLNMGAEALSYKVNPIVMTETLSPDYKTVAQKAYLLGKTFTVEVEGDGGFVSNGDTLIVEGYSDVKVTVTVSLDDEAKAYMEKTFANGMYVEGYIEMLSQNADKINLNVPYLAFYGDWSVAPMLDVTAYEVGAEQEDSSILEEDKLHEDVYATLPMGGFRYYTNSTDYEESYYGLAQFAYKLADGYEAPATIEEKASLTNNVEAVYSLAMIGAGLLRNAKSVDMKIEDSVTGEVIWQDTSYNVRKSYYGGGRRPGYLPVEFSLLDHNLANNSKYKFSMECFLDWHTTENNLKNTFEFEFYVDNEAPVLVEDKTQVRVEYVNNQPRYILDIYVYDNHYLQAYTMGTYSKMTADGEYDDVVNFHRYVLPVEDGKRNSENKLSYDITRYWDEIQQNGGKIYIQAIDYARNGASYTIELPSSVAQSIAFKSTKRNVNITANTIEDLKPYLVMNPLNLYVEDLVWSIDDESVALVRDGVVLGLKEGETTLRVSNKDGTCQATLPVIIRAAKVDEIALTQIRLNKNAATIVRGEELELNVTRIPHELFADVAGLDFTDTELTWSTAGGVLKFVVTDDNGNVTYTDKIVGSQNVVVKAMKSGSGTIKVTSTGGSFISTSCSVGVRDEFEMEGSILSQYHGRGDENGVVVIPEDLGVMWIANQAFFGNEYITKIVIPEGVDTLMEAAIYGCDNLQEVVFPQSLKVVEKWALAWNEKLTKVDLGGVDTIGEMTFVKCTSLTDIDLTNVSLIGPAAFAYCESLQYANLTNCKSMGAQAFLGCSSLEKIDTSEVTNLGEYAFANCMALTNLELNNTNVGAFAFAFCEGLQSVTFNNAVDTIHEGAFYGCSALTEVVYRSSVRVIKDIAFANCSLKTVYLPNGLETIGAQVYGFSDEMAASYGGPTKVVIAAGAQLQSIGNAVFMDCNNVTEFEVEEGNPYLSSVEGVLYDKAQTKLLLMPTMYKSYIVNVPTTVTTIGNYAFCNNKAILVINAPGVTRIEKYAFAGSSVQSFNLGLVDYVGDSAFMSSPGMAIWPQCFSNLTYIGEYAFAASGLHSTLQVPTTVEYLGEYAFAATKISSLILGENFTSVPNWAFAQNDNLVNIMLPNTIESIGEYAFAECRSLESVTLPASVQSIGEYAFAYCQRLKTINIPDGITEIADGTFMTTAIESITLPASVTKIGAVAFINSNGYGYDYTKLTSINLDNIVEIGDGAFLCASMETINAPKAEIIGASAFAYAKSTSINLPNATVIGDGAFAAAQASSISVPKAETIGLQAFYQCENLVELLLPMATTIGDFAFGEAVKLATLDISSAESIGESILTGTLVQSISLPATLHTIKPMAFLGAENLATVAIDAACENFFVDQAGAIYKVNPNGLVTLVAYPAGLTNENYVANELTVRVEAYAFAGSKALKTLSLPERLKVIGAGAFTKCPALQEITFNCVDAPVLEMFYNDRLGVEDHNYENFKNTDAKGTEITLKYPANGAGYDGYVWTTYFGSKMVKTETISRTATTIDMSDKLGAMDVAALTVEDIADIVLMRRVYTSLDAAQKAFLSSHAGKLAQAESQIASLVVAMIDALSATPTLQDKQAVAAARACYNKLNNEMKASVTNLAKLKSAEDAIAALEQAEPQQPSQQPDDTNTNNGWIVYVVAAVAVVAAAAVAFVIIKKRKSNGAEQVADAESVEETQQKEDDHE